MKNLRLNTGAAEGSVIIFKNYKIYADILNVQETIEQTNYLPSRACENQL